MLKQFSPKSYAILVDNSENADIGCGWLVQVLKCE